MGNFEKDRQALEKMIENKTICWSIVNQVDRDRSGANGEYMSLSMPKMNDLGVRGDEDCVIYAKEADADNQNFRVINLIGRKIPFVILDVDANNKRLICSRKEAQNILKRDMLQGLASKHIYEGTVVGFSNYGGYIEVNGITGYLRNRDLTEDHSSIQEHLKLGDKLNVRCKEITQEDGYIYWEAIIKVRRSQPLEYTFKVGSVVVGRVVRISDFKQGIGVFVNLQTGIDALCPVPRELEIEENVKVAVRIEQIMPGPNRNAAPHIRGRIIRVC